MVLGQGTGDRETGQETGRFQNHREALVWSRCRTPSILDPKAPNGSSGLPVPAHRPDLYTTSKHITYWYPYQVVSEDLVSECATRVIRYLPFSLSPSWY